VDEIEYQELLEYQKLLEEGLALWLDSLPSGTLDAIKTCEAEISGLDEKLNKELARFQDLLSKLPNGMPAALGYTGFGNGISIMPHAFAYAKKFNVSVEEAKKKLIENMRVK